MKMRTDLSAAAFAALRDFCAANLKSGLDADTYALGFVNEHENWEGTVVFEIRPFDSKSGNPATISFNDDADFEYADMDA